MRSTAAGFSVPAMSASSSAVWPGASSMMATPAVPAPVSVMRSGPGWAVPPRAVRRRPDVRGRHWSSPARYGCGGGGGGGGRPGGGGGGAGGGGGGGGLGVGGGGRGGG